MQLCAPDWYWDIPQEEREKGRCGPGKGIVETLVPETIYFMSVTDCCQIHDKEYDPEWNPDIQAALKLTDAQRKNTILIRIKKEADQRLLDNIIRKSNEYSANGIMRRIRNYRAMTYYNEVSSSNGKRAFWNNINEYESK